MGIASLVLGIVSLLITIFTAGAFGYIGAILAIVGIVLGAIGRKQPNQRGIATGGLVCSIVGLCLGVIIYIACVAVAEGVANRFGLSLF